MKACPQFIQWPQPFARKFKDIEKQLVSAILPVAGKHPRDREGLREWRDEPSLGRNEIKNCQFS
jgi:hypothetical protein